MQKRPRANYGLHNGGQIVNLGERLCAKPLPICVKYGKSARKRQKKDTEKDLTRKAFSAKIGKYPLTWGEYDKENKNESNENH